MSGESPKKIGRAASATLTSAISAAARRRTCFPPRRTTPGAVARWCGGRRCRSHHTSGPPLDELLFQVIALPDEEFYEPAPVVDFGQLAGMGISLSWMRLPGPPVLRSGMVEMNVWTCSVCRCVANAAASV
jgi:hypothetical protein